LCYPKPTKMLPKVPADAALPKSKSANLASPPEVVSESQNTGQGIDSWVGSVSFS
jgi:hypothetical protein